MTEINNFTSSEKRLIRAMYRLARPATAHEIAQWAHMSWNTANSKLEDLFKRKIVSYMRQGNKRYWILNY